MVPHSQQINEYSSKGNKLRIRQARHPKIANVHQFVSALQSHQT